MIAKVWPGNTSERRIVQGDWRILPMAGDAVGAAIGDGIVNMLRWPDDVKTVFSKLRKAIRPGGRIATRCFCSPEIPETLAEVCEAYLSGGGNTGFHAFKWRLAQAAMTDDNIGARSVWKAFEHYFPEREALASATGWPLSTISEIDDYRYSTLSKCFPTRDALKSLFPDARFVESTGYEMAERCPLMVIDL